MIQSVLIDKLNELPYGVIVLMCMLPAMHLCIEGTVRKVLRVWQVAPSP